MDGGSVTTTPGEGRLTQSQRLWLFGPMGDETLWVDRSGVTCPYLRIPKSDVEAWHDARDRGVADTADLEWKLYDHGVTVTDVQAQLAVAARALDDLGIVVEWEADGLEFKFRHGNSDDGVYDEPLGLHEAGFGPIDLFDKRTGGALTEECIRLQAAAFIEGVKMTESLRRMDAGVFVARNRVDVPADALDGMAPWQREWVAGGLRLGASAGRVLAVARGEWTDLQYIYDGPNMNEAVRAIREYVARMGDRQAASGVAAMSVPGGGAGHGVGGVSA